MFSCGVGFCLQVVYVVVIVHKPDISPVPQVLDGDNERLRWGSRVAERDIVQVSALVSFWSQDICDIMYVTRMSMHALRSPGLACVTLGFTEERFRKYLVVE